MSLDIWIYGPGFGEAILLIWDATSEEAVVRHAAFIDCFGGRDYDSHPSLCQWHDAGCPHVALVCITHPHLDHIQNASVMMAAAGCTADLVVWWGGQTLRRIRALYGQMSEDMIVQEQELGITSAMTWGFLNDVDALEKGKHKCRPSGTKAEVRSPMEYDLVYSGQTANGPLEFYAISPWLGPQTAYTRWIDSQICIASGGETEVRPSKGLANCTSLGFLIKYGKAQVLLGGDIEADNWTCLRGARPKENQKDMLPQFDPCLIKVSHHGSPTGEIDGMWKPNSGFFSSLPGTDRNPPHCVITPWRLGDPRWYLPKQDRAVLERIAAAGCHVWETASKSDTSPIDLSTRLTESYIHFVVDPKHNEARVIDEHFCRHTLPKIASR